MMQIADKVVIVAGNSVLPSAFTELVKRHPKGIEKAISLEREASRLLRGDFTDQHLSDFIQRVCEWGGYPRTAERVFEGNTFPEIRYRFENAIDALTAERPSIAFALREIHRVRHIGWSFASKHLRFLRPDLCPVLDSILSEKLGYALDVSGYRRFSADCGRVAGLLCRHGVQNPVEREDDRWYVADVEMALYAFSKESII